LLTAQYSVIELYQASCPAFKLIELGMTPSILKLGGYSARDLKYAKCTAYNLKQIGFTPFDLRCAEFKAIDLKNDWSVSDLRQGNYSSIDLHDVGFTATDLKLGGFSLIEIIRAKYILKDIKRAGFTATEIIALNLYKSDALRDAGFFIFQLYKGGMTDIMYYQKRWGFNFREILDAFSMGQIGFTSPYPTDEERQTSDNRFRAAHNAGKRLGFSESEIVNGWNG